MMSVAPAGRHLDACVQLEALARRIDRLVPDRRDPEAFHVEKSEVAAALRRLANETTRGITAR